MRKALLQSGRLSHLSQKIEQEPEYRHPQAARKSRRKRVNPN
jgi:hypothetical protein